MQLAQVSAKKLISPALAVLLMGTLAACGTGLTAEPIGPEDGSPHENKAGSQSRNDGRPGVGAAEVNVQPQSPAIVLGSAAPSGGKNPLDLSNRKEIQVDLGKYSSLLPQDAILPIYNPQFVTAEDSRLEPGELVIGVDLNGDAKAYPIGPLRQREMVNDTVGGVPILVTW